MEKPGAVRGVELFPDIDEEMDRRILHSEQRIKNWVLIGILSNIGILMGAGIPSVYYLGQVSRDVAMMAAKVNEQQEILDSRSKWIDDRIKWEIYAEEWMKTKGFVPPPVTRERPK